MSVEPWADPKLLARFDSYVEVVGEHWLWRGATRNGAGYGIFRAKDRLMPAHRFAHLRWIGPIPDGYQVDHLCLVKLCVRPSHLEAITQELNRRRQHMVHRRCFHDLSNPENVYQYDDRRECRQCHIGRSRRRRAHCCRTSSVVSRE